MARSELWFSFGGTSSADMGVRVTRLPELPVAEARGASVEIPGRDGALWLDDGGFRPVTVAIGIELAEGDMDAAAAWLTGGGALILSGMEDFYWKARVDGGFAMEPGVFAGGRRRATVAFRCQPFRYRVGDPVMDPLTEACTFAGDGTWTARPVITVNGRGDIDLMVNGATVLLDGVDGALTLDCDAMMAFAGGENASPRVTLLSDDDAWPALTPGENAVSWSGDVSSVVIQPNWRWR